MRYPKTLFSAWGNILFAYGPQCKALLDNGLFDASYYFEQNSEILGTDLDLLRHYLLNGFLHGKDPHPLFSNEYYLERYQDVMPVGRNPLIHYFQKGCRQGCNPHLLFDSSYYLETNPDVAKAGVNPLGHFIRSGFKEGGNPHPLFDTSYYLNHYPDVAEDGINPLIHYLRFGYKEKRIPHPLLIAFQNVGRESNSRGFHENPLLSFVLNGSVQGTNLHPFIHYINYNNRPKEDLYLHKKRRVPRKIKTILIFEHKIPRFDQDSGSLRLLGVIQILVEAGYRVILWVKSTKGHKNYSSIFRELGVELPYEDNDLADYLHKNGQSIDLAILCRKSVASSYLDIVMTMTEARIVFDTVDLVYLRNERKARLKGELIDESIKEEELHLARCADEVLVVSPVEKILLEEEGLKGKVSVVSNIHSLEPDSRSFAERANLMFIGGFEHPPNVDGIIWFVQSIFPMLEKQLQGIHFTIVGSYPPASIQALASDNITVTGYVRDISPYFEKARVFVSPLRYGAGVKGKIGQSLAFGLPVVTTSIGAEGMHLEDAKSAMIADDEELFAQKTIDLYGSQPLWETLSSNGKMVIEQYHTPEAVKKELLKVIENNETRNSLL